MTKNPVLNALAALVYITVVASVMFFGTRNIGPDNSVVIPIVMLSLFTLSAAVMGYIFLSNPLQLYLDGRKKEGIKLFTQTLAVFGGITALGVAVLISGLI